MINKKNSRKSKDKKFKMMLLYNVHIDYNSIHV